jgi:hypothetical protein
MKYGARRVWTGIAWAVLNYLTLYLQPVLGLDVESCRVMFWQSSLVAGVIVIGLSATDFANVRYNNKGGEE